MVRCPFCTGVAASCLKERCKFYSDNGCKLDQAEKLDQLAQLLTQIEINTRPPEAEA